MTIFLISYTDLSDQSAFELSYNMHPDRYFLAIMQNKLEHKDRSETNLIGIDSRHSDSHNDFNRLSSRCTLAQGGWIISRHHHHRGGGSGGGGIKQNRIGWPPSVVPSSIQLYICFVQLNVLGQDQFRGGGEL